MIRKPLMVHRHSLKRTNCSHKPSHTTPSSHIPNASHSPMTNLLIGVAIGSLLTRRHTNVTETHKHDINTMAKEHQVDDFDQLMNYDKEFQENEETPQKTWEALIECMKCNNE